MGWVLPTGFEDPWSDWVNEEDAYDNNTSTYAINTAPAAHHLTLTHAALNCDKVRVWAITAPADPGITVRVYYSGGWHTIHDGAFTEAQYFEIAIGSTESVTKIEFKAKDTTNFYIVEGHFHEVEAPPPTRRIFITQ